MKYDSIPKVECDTIVIMGDGTPPVKHEDRPNSFSYKRFIAGCLVALAILGLGVHFSHYYGAVDRSAQLQASHHITPKALTPEERSTTLSDLLSKKTKGLKGEEGWELLTDGRDGITKTFHFGNFDQAWEFMEMVADLAKEMNHHPEWFNVWNRVEVTMTTHEVGGLSSFDLEMATKMDGYELQVLSGQS